MAYGYTLSKPERILNYVVDKQNQILKFDIGIDSSHLTRIEGTYNSALWQHLREQLQNAGNFTKFGSLGLFTFNGLPGFVNHSSKGPFSDGFKFYCAIDFDVAKQISLAM